MRWLVHVIFREFIMKPVTVALSFFVPWFSTMRALRALRSPINKLSRTKFGRRVWRSIKAGLKGVFVGSIGVTAITLANKYLSPDYYFLSTKYGRSAKNLGKNRTRENQNKKLCLESWRKI